MTEALEIRTPHADVLEVVRELAPSVDDVALRLPCERPIADGQWVRFKVLLADGSTVFEGLGLSIGTQPDGPGLRVQLAQLQFDERNEVMYERMLLARDAAEETSTIELHEVGAELVRGGSRSAPPPPPRAPSTVPPRLPRPPRAPSPPPPRPPERALERTTMHAPVTKASAPPEPSPQDKPRARPVRATQSARPVPSSNSAHATAPRSAPDSGGPERSPAPVEPAEPRARRTPPPAAKRTTPTPRAPAVQASPAPKSTTSTPFSTKPAPATSPERAPSKPPAAAQSALSGGAADELAAVERPAPRSVSPPKTAGSSRPIRPPTTAARGVSDDLGQVDARPLRLEIPKRVVARAHVLASLLPAGIVDARGRAPEEAVLRVALRLGLATLAALAEDDDA
jgi:hypothetical protein